MLNKHAIAAAEAERKEKGAGLVKKAVLSDEIQAGLERREAWAMIDAANEIIAQREDYEGAANYYYDAGILGDDSMHTTVNSLVKDFSKMKREKAVDAIEVKLREHNERVKFRE
tara:strand:+ start:3671 stop:4012 length:342 start_codon:yes stop_codon:yes gene_type:complete